MYNESKYQKLRGYVWRKKGVKQNRGIVRALHQTGGLVAKRFTFIDVRYNPTYHTACWSFVDGKHRITVGGKFYNALTSAAQANAKHVDQAYRSLVRHECAHGKWTDDLELVTKSVKKAGIPFQLLNIFEDIRIEHLAREDKSGYDDQDKFGWDNWVEFPSKLTKAIEWLQWLCHREASSFKTLTSAEHGADFIGHSQTNCTANYKAVASGKKGRFVCTRKAVRHYYERIINTDNTLDLLPILRDWCELFGIDYPKGTPRVSDEINGKTEDGEAGPSQDTGRGHGNSGNDRGTGRSTQAPEPTSYDPNVGESALTQFETRGLGEFQEKYPSNPDEGQVKRIYNRLKQITKSGGIDRDQLGTSGTRLHLPEVIAQSDRFARRLTEVSGKRTITVIVDCSGSMSSSWCSGGGQEFVLALQQLHCRGILDIRLWLSGGKKAFRVPLTRTSAKDICRISPNYGCESFKQTIARPECQKDIADSSILLAWTDGCIGDGDVDHLAIKRKGVDVIGAAPLDEYYLSKPEYSNRYRNNIIHHFGKGWVGNADQLARNIAHHALSRR